MLNIQKLSLFLAGTAFIAISSSPAQAISITTGGTPLAGQGQVTSVPGATTINFNNGTAPTSGFAVYSTPATVLSGSASNQYAAPDGDASPYLTISPVGSNAPGNVGSVAINFASAIDYFGLYWGSVDTYNSIDFYSGGNLLSSFTGANIPGTTASGNQTSPQDNIYVNFFAGVGESFDKVVLKSTGIAFESDNHAYKAVPEPATVLGLLAFGAFGASSLAKRKAKAV